MQKIKQPFVLLKLDLFLMECMQPNSPKRLRACGSASSWELRSGRLEVTLSVRPGDHLCHHLPGSWSNGRFPAAPKAS